MALDRCKWSVHQGSEMVIIDDCFEYGSMRKVYYQLARELRVGYFELHIDCPLDVAMANNLRRQTE